MKYTILAAAIVIGGAILLNGYFDRASRRPHFSRPSNKQVEQTVLKSFDYAFNTLAGDNVIMEKKRDIQKVQIDDIRYTEKDARMLVKFTLFCKGGDTISSGIGLERDEFGIYRGQWKFGEHDAKRVVVELRSK